MKKYELIFILPGTLDDKEAETASQEILVIIQANALESNLHFLGKNRLAYPIRHIRYGYFYTIIFMADPAGLKLIQEKLVLRRELLRTMISYFNTTLTTPQKIVYATDESGLTTMRERQSAPAPEVVMPAVDRVMEAKPVVAVPVASTAERSLDKLDLDAINKKLDDIMSGDIMPGV